MKKTACLAVLICLAVSGCTLGPKYKRPKVTVPAQFGEQHHAPNAPPVWDWWREFHDPELNRLITNAVQANLNLASAAVRIRQARYQRSILAADLLPNADADAGYMRARGSKNVQLDLGNSGGSSGSGSSSGGAGSSTSSSTSSSSGKIKDQAQGGGSSSSTQTSAAPSPFENELTPLGKGGLPGVTTDLYQVGFDATWELDVFGASRKRLEAAADDISAAVEAWRDLTITLMAEVARDYFDLRAAQRRLQIARDNVGAQKKTLELTQSRQRSGLGSQLDVARAAGQVAITQATIPPLEAEIRREIHALSILEARAPEALSDELKNEKPLPPVPPVVPVGIPSQLLQRRPDIRRAERQIASATAQVAAARADLFPKFGLTGSVGLDSTSAQRLFEGQSAYFLVSPTVVWRVFDSGRILSNIALQRATQYATILNYRQTILSALQDVDDALVAYNTEQTRRQSLLESLRQSNESLRLARNQYEHGLATFLDVLDAQRTQLSAEDTLAQSDLTITSDLAALYKALGGGWNR